MMLYSSRAGTSSTQQESVRKMRQSQNRIDINTLNGKFGSALSLRNSHSPHFLSVHPEDGISAKRRKIGNESKTFEVLDADSEKELDDLPPIFCTPLNSKRDPKLPIPNLRAFSNENSRFVKNTKKKKERPEIARKHSLGEPRLLTIKAEPTTSEYCNDRPTTSISNPDLSSSGGQLPTNKCETRAEDELDSWVKRKFYIVENAGRPTEIYCTDFIHKVKQGVANNRYWTDDNRSLLKVTDKWREEWSANGVQVPLVKSALSNKREAYQFENTALLPEIQEYELFELPKKRVLSHYPTKYTNVYSKEFQQVTRQPLCCYLMDTADEAWLEIENEKSAVISTRTFVKAMNLLEVTTYKKIHDALLEPNKSARADSEEDAACMICGLVMPEWEAGDNIVFCDGCNISVHQSCYGLQSIPKNEWFCQLCSHFRTPTAQPCLFCPVKGGPMKSTKHMDSWAHVSCALWIPEVRFGDADMREPITHVNEIPAEKWQSRCCVCDTQNGACIKCVHPKCEATFHVGCAQRANFLLNIENDDHSESGVKMVSLCDKHSQTNSHRKIRLNKNRLVELMKRFAKFADPQELAKQSGIPMGEFERIYEYWVWKRTRQNYQHLISEPPEIIDATKKKAQVEAHVETKQRGKPPKRKQQASSSIYNGIPHEKLVQKYEGIRILRLNFEKARNLSYMVKQRERLKKNELEIFETQVQRTAANIFNNQPVIPISKRRLGRLLVDWQEAAEFTGRQ